MADLRLDACQATIFDIGRRLDRLDAQWRESDHPRATDGKFGSGGGGATSGAWQKNQLKPKTSSKILSEGSLKGSDDIRALPEGEKRAIYSWSGNNTQTDEFARVYEKLPKVRGNFVRGMTVPKGTEYSVGQEITNEKFTSSTTSLRKAQQFAQWSRYEDYEASQRPTDPIPVEETKFHKNDPVLFHYIDAEGASFKPAAEFIKKTSRFGGGFTGESEVVLPEKSKYKVVEVGTTDLPAFAKYQQAGTMRVVVLKPVV